MCCDEYQAWSSHYLPLLLPLFYTRSRSTLASAAPLDRYAVLCTLKLTVTNGQAWIWDGSSENRDEQKTKLKTQNRAKKWFWRARQKIEQRWADFGFKRARTWLDFIFCLLVPSLPRLKFYSFCSVSNAHKFKRTQINLYRRLTELRSPMLSRRSSTTVDGASSYSSRGQGCRARTRKKWVS